MCKAQGGGGISRKKHMSGRVFACKLLALSPLQCICASILCVCGARGAVDVVLRLCELIRASDKKRRHL